MSFFLFLTSVPCWMSPHPLCDISWMCLLPHMTSIHSWILCLLSPSDLNSQLDVSFLPFRHPFLAGCVYPPPLQHQFTVGCLLHRPWDVSPLPFRHHLPAGCLLSPSDISSQLDVSSPSDIPSQLDASPPLLTFPPSWMRLLPVDIIWTSSRRLNKRASAASLLANGGSESDARIPSVNFGIGSRARPPPPPK